MKIQHIYTDFLEERMKKILTIVCLAAALTLSACWGKSDADLQKAATDAVKNPAVTVTVKDGVATLTGEVADEAAVKAAETAAKVDGIKSVVVTGLKPKPTPPPATVTAVDTTKIKEALTKGGFKDVTIDTATTPATLRGTIAKGKTQELVKITTEAAGKPLVNATTEK